MIDLELTNFLLLFNYHEKSCLIVIKINVILYRLTVAEVWAVTTATGFRKSVSVRANTSRERSSGSTRTRTGLTCERSSGRIQNIRKILTKKKERKLLHNENKLN